MRSSVAAALGAHIAGLSCEVHVQLPGHFISGSMVGLPGIIAGEAAKSRRNAKDLIAAFDAASEKLGVSRESILQKCKSFEVPDLLVEYARLRDLTIVPVPESYDQWYAEAVIFGSGRPTLVLPQRPRSRPFELGIVAVAWDFSRAAARAIADAIPILEKAREVRIVTVTNEKVLDSKHSSEELAENLSRHGIDVVLDKVDAAGRTIGDVLEGACGFLQGRHPCDGSVRSQQISGVLSWRRYQEPVVPAPASDFVFALTGLSWRQLLRISGRCNIGRPESLTEKES